MARTRWPPDCEPWPLIQTRQNRNGTAGGCQKNLGPADRSFRKTTSGVSRLAGQAGTQATDPTPAPRQTQGSRAGNTYPHPPCRFRANGESAGQPGRHRQIRQLCVATSGTGLRWKPSILAVGALNPPWATAMERDAGRPALAWLTRQPTPGSRVGCQAQWLACGDGAAARCRRAQPPGLIRTFNRYYGDTSSRVALAKAAGLAWRHLWPLLRLFLPGAVQKCPAKGSLPGAVTAARGEPAGPRSAPVPLAGPRQGGIRTRPPRHLRLPRRARGAADRCASGAARRGLAAGPWWEQSWAGARPGVRCGRSRPRLNGGVPAGQAWPAARFYIRGLRDRLAKAIAAGAVSAAMAGCCVRDKEGQDGAGHGEVVQR